MIYPIKPCPAPRQVQSDRWNPRPMVLRYRAFRDEVRLRGVKFENGDSIIFRIPMPPSWSKKKKIAMNGKPHTQTPDLDNIYKSLADSIFKEDSHIWHLGPMKKIWAYDGSIEIF